MKRFAVLVATCLVMLSYGGAGASPQKEPPAAPVQPKHPGAHAQAENPSLSGTVVETMNAGGYTYVNLEQNGKKTWFAVPETQVAVGQKLTFTPGAEMENFTSKSLNRTFDRIIFSGGIASPSGGAGKPALGKKTSGSKGTAAALDKNVKVDKASGPDAYTVGEIYTKRTALNSKTVVVKGKVVKVSAAIMGKNWIHLQDGTGDPQKGTHNLVVTSKDLPAVNDVVTMKGTAYKDKDFGAGYKYTVIVEQATIER